VWPENRERERAVGLVPEIVRSEAISTSGNYRYAGNVAKVHSHLYSCRYCVAAGRDVNFRFLLANVIEVTGFSTCAIHEEAAGIVSLGNYFVIVLYIIKYVNKFRLSSIAKKQ
jgi:hypothetical protein